MNVCILASSGGCYDKHLAIRLPSYVLRNLRHFSRIKIRTVSENMARNCNNPKESPFQVKYIALLALVKIVPTHRNLVAEYQDMILSSISDQDLSIRMRALDLLSAMVCF